MNIKFNDFATEIVERREEYQAAIARVLDSGWFILGPEVKNFESQLAKYIGVKHCIGVANGLEALQISLMALGIGKGDEVITTPISAVATTLAIMAVGATPVFVDVDECGLIDAHQIESVITSQTKAIIPVHLYGLPTNLEKIQSICKKNKLYLIEDACQAHGTTYQNKKVGSLGDVGCFSFYPTKNIGAFGDGGAITTNDDSLASACYEIRDYGQKSKYVHSRYGLNSRLDELQAAILQVKLSHLDEDNSRRRQIADQYFAKLSEIEDLKTIASTQKQNSNFHLFPILITKRDELQAFLKEKNIPSLVHYPIAIPDQPMFENKYKNIRIPMARKIVNTELSLPCHPQMSREQCYLVIDTIYSFFSK